MILEMVSINRLLNLAAASVASFAKVGTNQLVTKLSNLDDTIEAYETALKEKDHRELARRKAEFEVQVNFLRKRFMQVLEKTDDEEMMRQFERMWKLEGGYEEAHLSGDRDLPGFQEDYLMRQLSTLRGHIGGLMKALKPGVGAKRMTQRRKVGASTRFGKKKIR
ncbi:MAG: hypothetical protein QOF14_830 [Hyphomicrobiales bacterium]|jgi:hypothetical protein|nr:hypothetical protein [Hyphomicrobiales bacterium]